VLLLVLLHTWGCGPEGIGTGTKDTMVGPKAGFLGPPEKEEEEFPFMSPAQGPAI